MIIHSRLSPTFAPSTNQLFNMAKEYLKENISEVIISLEKQALEQWNNGNPDGFLELSDEDVVYFDPFLEQKLEGWQQLKAHYEPLRGQVKVDRYEMKRPIVQATESMAVLTFNYNCSTVEGEQFKWNCTEVYRRNSADEWKIIQTHWSLIKPLG